MFLDTCERDILDVNSQAALGTQLDAATLGVGITGYYLNGDMDAPPPILTVSEDEYLLNGVSIGTRSPGVSLTDQWINSWDDYCVELTSEYGLQESYIAAFTSAGITQGTCASLTP